MVHNEDMKQQSSQQLNQAKVAKGSAEHTIQTQKETIDRLYRDVSAVSGCKGVVAIGGSGG